MAPQQDRCAEAQDDTYTLDIEDMSCAACVARVEKTLRGIDGVQEASVNLVEGKAVVRGGDPQAVAETVTRRGYPARLQAAPAPPASLRLQFEAPPPATADIEAALRPLDGQVQVQQPAPQHIELVTRAHPGAVLAALADHGWRPTLLEPLEEEGEDPAAAARREIGRSWRRALLAGSLGLGLMAAGMGGLLPAFDSSPGARALWSGLAVLCLFTMAYSGRDYYAGAWKQLRHRSTNMDTLVALGTGAAWLSSVLLLAWPDLIPGGGHLYLDTSVLILAFLQFGHALEVRARARTRDAIRSLVELAPRRARLLWEGREFELPVALLRVGDRLRVRPGERIPADGVVVEGRSSVDESMLSGESRPVPRQPGDALTGGTINGNGSLLMEVTRLGQDTTLAHIVELVRQAQASKPPIGRLVDRVAAVFVPVVLVIAALTFAAWLALGPPPAATHALTAAIAVLVIACPCALGLATPIAIMVGTTRAARLGVLIRNGDALQTAAGLTHLVVDKTGTLTEGRPRVTGLQVADGIDEEALLAAAAGLEEHSEHPLAGAVLAAARERGVEPLAVTGFEAVTGRGVQGDGPDGRYRLGNRAFLDENGVSLPPALLAEAERLGAGGAGLVFVARDARALGLLAVQDPLREDSAAAVAKLHAAGIRVVMCTGDTRATADAVAARLGIDEVHAGVMPADKLRLVERLQAQGHRVGMAGDGINDAPALAAADVGFAIGSGTDVAIESADITLAGSSLHSVMAAIRISRATLANIRQNLFGAFVYNVLGIPLAAGVFFPFTGWMLNPAFASAAMALSSVTVVSNANRLRFFDPDR